MCLYESGDPYRVSCFVHIVTAIHMSDDAEIKFVGKTSLFALFYAYGYLVAIICTVILQHMVSRNGSVLPRRIH
jgi:hypothetical protein